MLASGPTRTPEGGHCGAYGLITRSPGFEINDLGQMRSSDDIDFHADYQLRDTQPGKIFRFWQFGHDTQSSWSYGGVRRNSSLNQRLTLDFHNFWNFRYSTSRTFRGMSDKLTRGGPLMGTPSGWQYQASLTGNPGGAHRVEPHNSLTSTTSSTGGGAS